MKQSLNDPEKTKSAIVDHYSHFANICGEMIRLGAVKQEVKKIITGADVKLVALKLREVTA